MEFMKIVMDSGKEYIVKEKYYDEFFDSIGIQGIQNKRLKNSFVSLITENNKIISINPSHISSLEKVEELDVDAMVL